MPKAPFERVFSLIERKRLLSRVAKEKPKILLKTAKNDVVEFKVQGAEASGDLLGNIAGGTLRDFDKITALFYVGNDRYFLTTRIKKKDDFFVLINDAQFYKFNRRAAFRVQIPASVEVSFFISTIRNIEINRKVSVLEFSSGGARIYWPGERKLSKGTMVRGSLQWGKGKILPVEASVVHTPGDGIFAVRFVNLNTVLTNRLKMLSIEIQQAIHFGL